MVILTGFRIKKVEWCGVINKTKEFQPIFLYLNAAQVEGSHLVVHNVNDETYRKTLWHAMVCTTYDFNNQFETRTMNYLLNFMIIAVFAAVVV